MFLQLSIFANKTKLSQITKTHHKELACRKNHRTMFEKKQLNKKQLSNL